MEVLPVTLLDLLSNSIILRQTSPYLSLQTTLDLGATCKSFQDLICHSPDVCRHMDLSRLKSAVTDSTPIDTGGISWRAERMDEALTEDDFYCGPVRGMLSKLRSRHMLKNVNTLILDGLSVPADLVREIITDPTYNVRILSIRECKHLNERLLNQVLRYAVRPTRPDGTPRLKGLYIFGPKEASTIIKAKSDTAYGSLQAANSSGVTSSEGAQIGAEWNQKSSEALASQLGQPEDKWYRSSGRMIKPFSEWPETLQACEGLIAFDAVLCRGPRHDPAFGKDYLKPAIATIALGPKGCETCGSCPEGSVMYGRDPEANLPMLTPPPLHASTVKAAQCPTMGFFESENEKTFPRLMLRCEDCLRGRWCERCNKWWCETCYQEPSSRSRAQMNEDLQHHYPAIENSNTEATGNDQYLTAMSHSVKVYFNVCVESCLRSELLPVVDGMWG